MTLQGSENSLARFIDAQAPFYTQALAELRAGEKASHWIWFIFPQILGLGRSETARFYAIANLIEAQDYLRHQLLGARLSECTVTMLEWAGKRSAEEILGPVDAMKFASSMTLFEAAGGDARFAEALDAFFAGERDQATLALLRT